VITYQVDRGGLQHRELDRCEHHCHTSALDPLFSVSRILTLAPMRRSFIVGAGNHSIFVEGTFDQLKGQTSTAKLMTSSESI